MIVAVHRKNAITKMNLPDDTIGNYIIKDDAGNAIGHLEHNDSGWIFNSNINYDILYNGNTVHKIIVAENSQITINNIIEHTLIQVYFYPLYVTGGMELKTHKNKISIGRATNNDISYSSPLMKDVEFTLSYENNIWYLEIVGNYVHVNNQLVRRKRLNHGDVIFSCGLKIVCISDYLVVNNLVQTNRLSILPDTFEEREKIHQEVKENTFELESEKEVFNPDEQFLRSPRFKTSVKEVEVQIAPPPQAQKQRTTPTILIVGPQMTMILSGFINLSSTFMSITSGSKTLSSSLPSVILSVAMMVSSLLWPSLTRKYNKREQRRKELVRIKKYRAYLENKEKEIIDIIAEQKQIIIENNLTLENCQQIIYDRRRNLWERTIEDEDFLSVRLGTGYVPPNIKINFKEEEFSMEDDFLKNELKEMIKKFDYVEQTPLNTSFLENRITAIIGNRGLLKSFFEGILLQLMTFHIYSELKIVILSDEEKVEDWDFLKFSPHCWDNQHTMRFIAATVDEKKKVSAYLENIVKERMESLGGEDEKKREEDLLNAYKNFQPYYLIITDNIESVRNLEIVNEVLNMKGNLGFSMIIKHNRIANLPNQCSTFINISENSSGLFKNDLDVANQKQFTADFNKTVNVEDCVRQLANIYVQIPLDKHELPKSVGFLEMYGVGNLEQLNSLDRWKNNNPVTSLSVPVGIDQNGELFNMDIHEKAYGPHGLVAGTTGSGKSEWIITYILSLCINFSPEEVQFVLIDYKGGGLAGSFENKETGMHLPHLVGTITNLDKSEIRRSLASLEAESKRRQRMFNEAREKLNDSSMNIYKYQQYYRKGMLDEPLSHLFIISDEFAELKSQEPEFLNQLVSIARIGRSLGIHLILATQKPAGVVDEQMWSNSRFKICLRVQDKSDSKDMIKCDDAAYLKQTGAFYLQVGMNEYFALGQSAYAGGKYQPTSIVKKKIETSLDVLDRTGDVLNTVDYIKPVGDVSTEVHGEELLNIILYVSALSKQQNHHIRKLWLEAIPEIIYVDNLKKKYPFTRIPFIINPIIGEYDDPYNQKQALLCLNLNRGNVYINGVSGSGKEQLLQAMLYSTIVNYTPQEVSLYICDFGAETLAMFEDAPHVGGIVYQNNLDKIENTFRFAWKEYRARRKKYREYGGNYESYIKYGKEKDSLMVFIINSVETLKELLPETYDDLTRLFKESAKYGIIFVLTSVDFSAVRGRDMSSFPQMLCLRNANDDYSSMLGKGAKGINPKDLKGRGLLEIDETVYEFQTASIAPVDRLQQVVKAVSTQLDNYYKIKAPRIPMIPKTLNLDVIDKSKLTIDNICVGYLKNTIEPQYFNFKRNFGTLILAPKRYNLTEYVKVLYGELELVANADDARVYLFDPDDLLKSEHYSNIKYVSSEEVVNTFNNLLIYINGEYEKYQALENKADYHAPRRSLIVIHDTASFVQMIGKNLFAELNKIVDRSRELSIFDFILADVLNDFKDIGREKALQKIFMDSNGILIGNTYDSQTFVELNSKDIKIKDSLADNMGYIVQNGKAYYSQLLEYTVSEESEEDE